jgi:DNA repair protein RadD
MNTGITPKIKLWDYQQISHDAAEIGLSDRKRTLLVMPTGSGKTIVARAIVLKYLEQGKSVLWLAHRRELLAQAERSICSGLSIQSVQGFKPDGDYDLIVTDEAHHCTAKSYQRIYDLYPKALRLGLSATPERLDGMGLGAEFDVMVQTANVENLIADGHLASIRYFVPEHTIETDGVTISRGDYDKSALSKNARHPQAISDAIGEYKTHAEGRRGIVFCLDQDHARVVTAAYIKAGYRATSIDSKTPTKRRDEIFRQWESGSIDIICNCALFVEGLDIKNVDFVQVLRPTQSRSLYFQMIGRGMRKSDRWLHVLDHTTNWTDIGLPSQHHEYKLTTEVGKGSAVGNRTRMERSESGELVDTGEAIEEYRSPKLVALDAWHMKTADVIQLLKANPEWTNAKIAELVGVGASKIRDLRKQLGIDNPNKPKMTDVQLAQATELLTVNSEFSNSKIAELVGVGGHAVGGLRKRLGAENPNSYPKMTEAQLAKAAELLKANPEWTNVKIAELVGVGGFAILHLRKRLGTENPNSWNRLTEAQRCHATELIKANPEWTNAKIAELVGAGASTIGNMRKKIGVENPNSWNRMTEAQHRHATELLKAHPEFSNPKIAELVGIGGSAILRLRKRLGAENPNSKSKMTEAQLAKAAELLKTNPEWTNVKIAELVGVSTNPIRILRKRLDVDNPNNPKMTEVQLAKAAELLKTNPEWTNIKIAELVGVSRSAIQRRRKKSYPKPNSKNPPIDPKR